MTFNRRSSEATARRPVAVSILRSGGSTLAPTFHLSRTRLCAATVAASSSMGPGPWTRSRSPHRRGAMLDTWRTARRRPIQKSARTTVCARGCPMRPDGIRSRMRTMTAIWYRHQRPHQPPTLLQGHEDEDGGCCRTLTRRPIRPHRSRETRAKQFFNLGMRAKAKPGPKAKLKARAKTQRAMCCHMHASRTALVSRASTACVAPSCWKLRWPGRSPTTLPPGSRRSRPTSPPPLP